MLGLLAVACLGAAPSQGLRIPVPGGAAQLSEVPLPRPEGQPRPHRGLKRVRASEFVPHCLLDSEHIARHEALGLKDCLGACEGDALCIGLQHWDGPAPTCTLRHSVGGLVQRGILNETCRVYCKAQMEFRSFTEIPMVPVSEGDGITYMREDCVDKGAKKHSVTYRDIPWDWEQPGLSLTSPAGYGASPLLALVTPSVLGDLQSGPCIGACGWEAVDVTCEGPLDELAKRLGQGNSTSSRALIVDAGACICELFGSGWDPSRDLRADAVFLFPGDENYSPASPFMPVTLAAASATRTRCVQRGGGRSSFPDDVAAFTALAESEHTRAMYFSQTPPIAHDKLFVTPLGIAPGEEMRRALSARFAPGSPASTGQRTALYEVSHNLAIDYRLEVFKTVRRAFDPEPLRQRHLPKARGRRLEDVVAESFQAVFGQSPPGIGENCYRHYELLAAGAIPVVQASLGVAAMRYLPHLAVSNWTQVTPALLRRKKDEIWARVRRGDFSLEPLTRGFWQRHILDMASGRGVPAFYAKFENPEVTCHSWRCI